MIWPFSKFQKYESEKYQLEQTIISQNELLEIQYVQNNMLKKHIINAADVLKKKEEDFKTTIAFLELQKLSNKK